MEISNRIISSLGLVVFTSLLFACSAIPQAQGLAAMASELTDTA